MNEYSDSFEFLQEYSTDFKQRQALSRVSNSIVECRWKDKGVCAQWREIVGESATAWRNVFATEPNLDSESNVMTFQIQLSPVSHEKAIRIGKGDASEGIRKALADYVGDA